MLRSIGRRRRWSVGPFPWPGVGVEARNGEIRKLCASGTKVIPTLVGLCKICAIGGGGFGVVRFMSGFLRDPWDFARPVRLQHVVGSLCMGFCTVFLGNFFSFCQVVGSLYKVSAGGDRSVLKASSPTSILTLPSLSPYLDPVPPSLESRDSAVGAQKAIASTPKDASTQCLRFAVMTTIP